MRPPGRSLVYRSIDGKKSIFSDGDLIFSTLFLKMAKNRILLKYSVKNYIFLTKTYEKYLSKFENRDLQILMQKKR